MKSLVVQIVCVTCLIVLLNFVAVEAAAAPEDCMEAIRKGPCTFSYKRYGYDPIQRECVEFIYGGCNGNRNKFLSLEECNSKCL